MRLNPAQQAAVDHVQGPLLVLAGAGSGKTRVITHRIARLVQSGVRPESILAVSFTNKAAGELGERMAPLVGANAARELWLSTFHSFGVRFLSETRSSKGRDGRFVIFDQGDSIGLVRQLLRQHWGSERKLDVPAVLARISLWKNAFVGPEAVPEATFEYDEAAAAVYGPYEDALRTMRAFDFDDLVLVPARMLEADAALRERWQGRFRHILIDEFQDTNRAQLALTQALVSPLRNLCVVGDDDQAIYGWRGAEVDNILQFERIFPGTTVVKLETNYRSTQPILDLANAAIAQGTDRPHRKTLRSARGEGTAVRFCAVDDTAEEAQLVGREISDLHKAGKAFAKMAVLYRSNLQGRLIEEALRALAIPYRVFGGTQFYDRKEVKDAIAYLRVLVNPYDELSFRRVLNTPARGVGPQTVEKLASLAQQTHKPLAVALFAVDELGQLAAHTKRSLSLLGTHLQSARRQLEQGAPLSATAEKLLTAVGLRDALTEEEGAGGARRWENVAFLLRGLQRFEAQHHGGGKPRSLASFLQNITLKLDKDEEAGKNQVTLSTLHAAKGLEFSVVFLIGCVEGQLPHSRTTDPKVTEAAPSDIEEERRLFYVGVTRAEDVLYVTRPRRRTLRGRTIPLTPSRFLDGLPEDAIEHYQRPDKLELGATEVADMAKALLQQLSG